MLTKDRMIPFIVSSVFFMEALDATVINTALPAMSVSLNVSPIDLKIALISYLLSLAILIPISGWIADKFGIKRVFIFAIGLFTLSSIACGLSQNLWQIVCARILQGLGGSLTMPLGRLIIARTFARHELLTIMSRVVMVGALGLMLGPVLGGFITHYLTWRWIFYINIPVGIIGILLSKRWLTESEPQTVPPLDIMGFLLFGSSLALFIFGLSALSESNVNFAVPITVLVTGTILIAIYMRHSNSKTHPIVKREPFQYRTFRMSICANLFSRLGFGGMPFAVPLLLQIGLGYPAQISGMLLAPMALGIILIKPLTMPLLRMFGYKKLLMLNTVVIGLSIAVFALVDAHTSFYVIGMLSFVFGFLIALQYGSMNSLAYAEVSQADLSAVTSIMSTIQQLSQSMGVAVCALLLRIFLYPETVLTTPIFHHAFLAMGAITILSSLMFIHLQKGDGQQMIK